MYTHITYLFYNTFYMNYWKLIASTALVALSTTSYWAHAVTYSADTEVQASAGFLADMGVIEKKGSLFSYNLDNDITRREMLKVMMNISWKNVTDTCEWKFNDLDSDDWGCKYAESALANSFIAANASFRPDDKVSQAEALKMVMQARWINKDENSDWRAGYESKAMSEGILSSELNYSENAKRGLIFKSSARSYSNFQAMKMDDESGLWVKVGGAMMVDTKNIVENAQASSEHTTLVSAVVAAGLDSTLSTGGPYTVFAPTNDAFDLLPDGTVSSLMVSSNKATLTDILSYHVVEWSYKSSDIKDGMTLTTIQGETLEFSIVDNIIYINGEASITTANAPSSNGLTHVIDKVLMPSNQGM